MNPASRDPRSAVYVAAMTAAAMTAFQVGARATRDAFFLSSFPIVLLPAMMAVTSGLAVVLALAATRVLSRWGPGRVIPASFAGSGLLLLLEWTVAAGSPQIAAVLLYLHYGCLGALLISGFWSLVNERFDPRTAKRELGGIMAAGTVGGLVGGLIAAQVGRILPVTAMLPILAAFHLVSAVSVLPLHSAPGAGAGSVRSESGRESPDVRAVARTPYLRSLILLVLLTTICEGLIDLVFKGQAAAALGQGGTLLQFFAAFYVAISLLTVILQSLASRLALTRLGPARTAALLPAGTAIATAGAILVPGLSAVVVARGVQSVLFSSLYRGGYGVLFTPVPAREKRAIRSLADVGASRLGDLVAAAIAQAVMLAQMPNRGQVMLAMAVVLSLGTLYLALRLHRGYVQALARGLLSRKVQLGTTDVEDSLTQLTVLQTLGPEGLGQLFPVPGTPPAAPPPRGSQDAKFPPPDPSAPDGAVYTHVMPAPEESAEDRPRPAITEDAERPESTRAAPPDIVDPPLPAVVPAAARDSPAPESSALGAELVDTAVFCPPRVACDSVFLVQVFLYPPGAGAEVHAQALMADKTAEQRGIYSLPLDLPRGTRVDLHLELPGLIVPEPDAVLVWRGSPTAAQFEARVPADAADTQTIGRVRIAVAGVPAGTLRFQVTLTTAGSTPSAADARELRARRYRRAFASYSSTDRAEVLRRVQAFRIAGLSVFQDILDLDPGERWEKALYHEIDRCDVFLLFWSHAAAASEWVRKEIEYALARKQGDEERPPDIQPVPIEGPPIVPPPGNLKDLHFNDALLAQIRTAETAAGQIGLDLPT